MLPHAAECDRLSLMVQRWLDADLLLAEEGDTLRAQINAARRAREEGDEEAVRRHLRQLARAIKALVRDGLLEEAPGRAALEAVRQMFVDPAG